LNRFWRWKPRPRAYDIIPGKHDGVATAMPDWPYPRGDVWILRYRGSEIDDGSVAVGPPYEAGLDTWVNGEPIAGQDVVIWYGAHFSHDVSHETPGEFGHVCGRTRSQASEMVAGCRRNMSLDPEDQIKLDTWHHVPTLVDEYHRLAFDTAYQRGTRMFASAEDNKRREDKIAAIFASRDRLIASHLERKFVTLYWPARPPFPIARVEQGLLRISATQVAPGKHSTRSAVLEAFAESKADAHEAGPWDVPWVQ
jgi:hypothetical protein